MEWLFHMTQGFLSVRFYGDGPFLNGALHRYMYRLGFEAYMKYHVIIDSTLNIKVNKNEVATW